jgi:hypothetical protein
MIDDLLQAIGGFYESYPLFFWSIIFLLAVLLRWVFMRFSRPGAAPAPSGKTSKTASSDKPSYPGPKAEPTARATAVKTEAVSYDSEQSTEVVADKDMPYSSKASRKQAKADESVDIEDKTKAPQKRDRQQNEKPALKKKTDPLTISPAKVKKRAKPASKDPLPPVSEVLPQPETGLVRVNYTPDIPAQAEAYPVFRYPAEGTVVRSYRSGSNKQRGFKEASFQRAVELYLGHSFFVSGDLRINIGEDTRPFEPDIALVGQKDRALSIDIEIDEPYAGITRQPTHCKDEDTLRDLYFTDRGWIVIRFSEYQVHCYEKACIRFIADVIKAVWPGFSIPTELQGTKAVSREKFWDDVQAQKWEKLKYREEYLGHTFKRSRSNAETPERGLNAQEKKEEKEVRPTVIGEQDSETATSFNLKNRHPRDARIVFYPEPHVYTIDGVPAHSATGIVSKFFPVFDAWTKAENLSSYNKLYGLPTAEIVKIWEERSNLAAQQGTELHE